MTFQRLLSHLDREIDDPAEETFLLFSQPPVDSQNLGFIDPRAQTVHVTVAGREFNVHQSLGLLSSRLEGGTTGAVLWKIAPIFADFIASPTNPFFAAGVLGPSASILELGCGISPLTGLALGPFVAHYLLTDQPYVQRLVNQNLDENAASLPDRKKKGEAKPKQKKGGRTATTTTAATPGRGSRAQNVTFQTLDWETDAVTSGISPTGDFDVVIACDCVYNEALVRPLVQTCVDACMLRSSSSKDDGSDTPTICVVAQQLRSDEVFEHWLVDFHRNFRVWRLPDEILPRPLRSDAGFVIHIGVVRSLR